MFVIAKGIGNKFERDLAEEFGLSLVPGSGNKWHSKLDLHGRGARWSLKATEKNSASITVDVIEEAIRECGGLSGSGEMPIWAFRIKEHDMIMLRKEDFVSLQKGELELINTNVNNKMEQKRMRSKIPRLLRDE